MKNILKQIKQIFVENKEYFIRCTIMTMIAGLILGISISLVVPASAAEEPTEGGQFIIPAGVYRWNDIISPPTNGDIQLSIPCYLTPVTITSEYEGEEFSLTYGGEYIHIDAEANGNLLYGYIDGTLTHQQCYSSAYGWDYLYNDFLSFDGLEFPQLLGFGQSFVVTSDTFVDSAIYDWFSANTNIGGDVDPDPEYTISSGWYLWQEELLGEFIPHTLTFNYRTFQRVGASGIPYYSYWSSMLFDNYSEDDSYFSRLYYSSISNGRILVYDDINGGWVDETYRRFYIASPLTLSAEDYFIFSAYTEYYGDTPPSFSGETVPSVPDPDSNIFTNIIGGVLEALDAFTIIGGFSLLDLITTLLGGMALVWILKLLAGG